ncbi:Voltage-dependent T-type calcium channel subunit alpha-1H [Tetrabaena socialis]|uniref:Voltage-dependent T-type calcium channel subunit alpha-1H n=1 Tax=Tetrabaena socialis TaxID=47790 RepID=A0A2J7ZQ82_9CHLO|nr:Voltage-dependent T-type calcium channel subunit alpha-1H [Tetrabaena socialis]|eukprot:PNH02425.1 Voltage-dependent T-type calcium channel subunit alpha-1H [Tetrabaena socialis]
MSNALPDASVRAGRALAMAREQQDAEKAKEEAWLPWPLGGVADWCKRMNRNDTSWYLFASGSGIRRFCIALTTAPAFGRVVLGLVFGNCITLAMDPGQCDEECQQSDRTRGFYVLRDFMLLLALFIFIFSVLGLQQFGGLWSFTAEANPGWPDKARSNFDTLWVSGYTVFQILTCEPEGDDWMRITWNGMRGAGDSAVLYFIAWAVVGNFILLSLFLAILITTFQLVLKHVALGWVRYWADGWNLLDAAVVAVSVAEIIVVATGGGKTGTQALRTLRLLRILRTLKLLRRIKSLHRLVKVVLRAEDEAAEFAAAEEVHLRCSEGTRQRRLLLRAVSRNLLADAAGSGGGGAPPDGAAGAAGGGGGGGPPQWLRPRRHSMPSQDPATQDNVRVMLGMAGGPAPPPPPYDHSGPGVVAAAAAALELELLLGRLRGNRGGVGLLGETRTLEGVEEGSEGGVLPPLARGYERVAVAAVAAAVAAGAASGRGSEVSTAAVAAAAAVLSGPSSRRELLRGRRSVSDTDLSSASRHASPSRLARPQQQQQQHHQQQQAGDEEAATHSGAQLPAARGPGGPEVRSRLGQHAPPPIAVPAVAAAAVHAVHAVHAGSSSHAIAIGPSAPGSGLPTPGSRHGGPQQGGSFMSRFYWSPPSSAPEDWPMGRDGSGGGDARGGGGGPGRGSNGASAASGRSSSGGGAPPSPGERMTWKQRAAAAAAVPRAPGSSSDLAAVLTAAAAPPPPALGGGGASWGRGGAGPDLTSLNPFFDRSPSLESDAATDLQFPSGLMQYANPLAAHSLRAMPAVAEGRSWGGDDGGGGGGGDGGDGFAAATAARGWPLGGGGGGFDAAAREEGASRGGQELREAAGPGPVAEALEDGVSDGGGGSPCVPASGASSLGAAQMLPVPPRTSLVRTRAAAAAGCLPPRPPRALAQCDSDAGAAASAYAMGAGGGSSSGGSGADEPPDDGRPRRLPYAGPRAAAVRRLLRHILDQSLRRASAGSGGGAAGWGSASRPQCKSDVCSAPSGGGGGGSDRAGSPHRSTASSGLASQPRSPCGPLAESYESGGGPYGGGGGGTAGVAAAAAASPGRGRNPRTVSEARDGSGGGGNPSPAAAATASTGASGPPFPGITIPTGREGSFANGSRPGSPRAGGGSGRPSSPRTGGGSGRPSSPRAGGGGGRPSSPRAGGGGGGDNLRVQASFAAARAQQAHAMPARASTAPRSHLPQAPSNGRAAAAAAAATGQSPPGLYGMWAATMRRSDGGNHPNRSRSNSPAGSNRYSGPGGTAQGGTGAWTPRAVVLARENGPRNAREMEQALFCECACGRWGGSWAGRVPLVASNRPGAVFGRR